MWKTPFGDMEVKEIHDWYDGPLLLTGKIGEQLYFIIINEETDTHDRWYFAPVTEQREQDILQNKITLKDAFVKSETGFVYEFYLPVTTEAKGYTILIPCEELKDEDLPDEGIYLNS